MLDGFVRRVERSCIQKKGKACNRETVWRLYQNVRSNVAAGKGAISLSLLILGCTAPTQRCALLL